MKEGKMLGVDKELLDAQLGGGCTMPDCDHPHTEELYMHGRCHPHARVNATILRMDGVPVLHVSCVECSREILDVNLQDSVDRPIMNACHPRDAFDVRYVRGSGIVEVLCSVCHQPAADLVVQRGDQQVPA